MKAVADRSVRDVCLPVIIADLKELRRQADILGLPCGYQTITEDRLASPSEEEAVIFDTLSMTGGVSWGALSAEAGRAAVSFIEAGARLCMLGALDAIATAPINKESIRLAGSRYTGHTEMLAGLTGAATPLMCFFAGDLKVVLMTIHLSLRDAINEITEELVTRTVTLADRELRRFGTARPRIAVAGLNPHAGEHGMFGSEDELYIRPGVEHCRAQGIDVSGPFAADTLFIKAARGAYDVVVACYHDQGLIAVKCIAFGEAVNVTLGLPIIRTSVDHGTAFDIAGHGVADHRSLVSAIKLAANLSSISGS